MKKQIIYALLVLLITPIVALAKGKDAPPVIETAHALAPASQKAETNSNPSVEPEAQQTAQNVPAEPIKPTTCREAIASVIPANLQAGFVTVLTKENGTEAVDRVGATNSDGSTDFGCFQINDRWHPDYFSQGDWRDPVWAAQYALKIYEGRQASNGNGWSAWYAVQGILW